MHAARFSRYFEANPGRLHFAAHSHHPWPDASREAHMRYWDDAATLADRKWERIFGETVPRAQAHVARLLQLSDPGQVAFAPNTHEFVVRLLSCLPQDRPLRVLASAHEFHSFRRQLRRLEEAGRVHFTEIPAPPWDTFTRRFIEAERREAWDLVWVSHVLFDSGFVVPDLDAIAEAAPPEALVAFDGYHAFCALPVDLSRCHHRAFYLAGGYKYAMSGEGACFLAVPPGCRLRPVSTGWFASFETLPHGSTAEVPYAPDGFRFWGSTFDASGIYRFNAAMEALQAMQLTIADVHRHALGLQKHFLDGLARLALPALPATALVPPAAVPRGNFLAFDIDGAEDVHRRIAARDVTIDRRDRRLRFGFGIYQDERQVERLLERIGSALQ
jgi:kynureninase